MAARPSSLHPQPAGTTSRHPPRPPLRRPPLGGAATAAAAAAAAVALLEQVPVRRQADCLARLARGEQRAVRRKGGGRGADGAQLRVGERRCHAVSQGVGAALGVRVERGTEPPAAAMPMHQSAVAASTPVACASASGVRSALVSAATSPNSSPSKSCCSCAAP